MWLCLREGEMCGWNRCKKEKKKLHYRNNVMLDGDYVVWPQNNVICMFVWSLKTAVRQQGFIYRGRGAAVSLRNAAVTYTICT